MSVNHWPGKPSGISQDQWDGLCEWSKTHGVGPGGASDADIKAQAFSLATIGMRLRDYVDSGKHTVIIFCDEEDNTTTAAGADQIAKQKICNGPNCPDRHVTTKLCGRCRQVRYCSQKCQADHWKAEHKNVCASSHSST